MAMKNRLFFLLLPLACICCRGPVVGDPEPPSGEIEPFEVTSASLARLFASLPMGPEQLREVWDAVGRSSGSGYDEEYTLGCLVSEPGSGVGPASRAPEGAYALPLREMIRAKLAEMHPTRSGVDDIMDMLAESGYQVYWPYSEEWDGITYPIITYDPGFGAESNYGYELEPGEEGARVAATVYVDEAMAKSRPVWVINSNSDSAFTPLELFRRSGDNAEAAPSSRQRRLILKSFKMLRNYDSWFGGASEFWVKCGSVSGFTASTEAELKLFSPSITDFMIVVRRRYLGKELPYEAIIVTDFTQQLDKLAFLVTEDDGGTHTNWKCEAAVKIQSKSYGVSLDIPYNDKDDIVWRGQLSARFFEEEDVVTGRFGDVVISFELE